VHRKYVILHNTVMGVAIMGVDCRLLLELGRDRVSSKSIEYPVEKEWHTQC